MGLVNKILPDNNFEIKCIEESQKLSGLDMKVVKNMKKLTYSFKTELKRYFESEEELII